MAVLLHVWSKHQQGQHHWGACWKCRCLIPIPDFLDQDLWGWGPETCKPALQVCYNLRSSDVNHIQICSLKTSLGYFRFFLFAGLMQMDCCIIICKKGCSSIRNTILDFPRIKNKHFLSKITKILAFNLRVAHVNLNYYSDGWENDLFR